MQKYINTIIKCKLFYNIEKNDLLNLLCCLGATVKKYKKEEYIQNQDEKNLNCGIVLDGAIQTIYYDYYGNRTILNHIEPLQLFGIENSFSQETFQTAIIATEDCTILQLIPIKISEPCQNHCKFHNTLIKNLLKILATKNIELNKKIKCMSKRTTRDKLLGFLYIEAQKQKSNEFFIPYDRQGLADYLCVERSAMSAEISKLRNENIIECKKNKFKIL